jgi:hypothetical protein
MFKRSMASGALTLLSMVILALSLYAQEKEPPVVKTPVGQPPSDAVVLFNGADLKEWQGAEGKPAGWIVAGGTMTVKGGSIHTQKQFGDQQIHLEFAAPSPAKGEGQDRGNSGVYIQGTYELQVLDSYNNKTYIDGMCGAIYKEYPPLVNANREPGQWQVYDIVFHAAKLDASGKVVKKANVTVLFNGVLIQDHVEIIPSFGGLNTTDTPRGPLMLQDHNHPVKFRNIWIREL